MFIVNYPSHKSFINSRQDITFLYLDNRLINASKLDYNESCLRLTKILRIKEIQAKTTENPHIGRYENLKDDSYFWNHLSHHLLQVSEWNFLYDLLTDFDYLESKERNTNIYDLVGDYKKVLKNWSGENEREKVLSTFEEWLRLKSHHIARAPELLFPALFNHLYWSGDSNRLIQKIYINQAKNRKNWLRNTQDPLSELHQWDLSIEGHTLPINTVSVTSNGEEIVSGSSDQTIKIWDFSTGNLLRTLDSHTNAVNSVSVTMDSTQIVSGSSDQTIKIWGLTSGKLLRTIEGLTCPHCLYQPLC